MEIAIAGQAYRTGKLDARKQFHLSRKLLPLVISLSKGIAGNKEVQALLEEAKVEGVPEKKDALTIIDLITSALEPASGVLSEMSEDDMDYIINTCLRVCDRKVGETSWAPCMATGSTKFMFDDMQMPVLVRLATAVVMENVGSFFLENQSKSP